MTFPQQDQASLNDFVYQSRIAKFFKAATKMLNRSGLVGLHSSYHTQLNALPQKRIFSSKKETFNNFAQIALPCCNTAVALLPPGINNTSLHFRKQLQAVNVLACSACG